MRYFLNSNLIYLNRGSSSVTLRRQLEDGFLLRHTMTVTSTPRDQSNGCVSTRQWNLNLKEQALKVCGETRMASATGERSGSKSTCQRVRDSKVSGRIPRRNAAYSESNSYLTRKIQGSSQRGSRKPMRAEHMLTLWSGTTTTLRTCLPIRSLRLTTTR